MKLIALFSLVAITSTLAVDIIPRTVETKTQAQFVAENLVTGTNDLLAARVEGFKSLWSMLWENPRATPEEILAALGPKAKAIFVAAGIARAELDNIAAAYGTTALALVGDAKYLTPAKLITIHGDGTVTVK